MNGFLSTVFRILYLTKIHAIYEFIVNTTLLINSYIWSVNNKTLVLISFLRKETKFFSKV